MRRTGRLHGQARGGPRARLLREVPAPRAGVSRCRGRAVNRSSGLPLCFVNYCDRMSLSRVKVWIAGETLAASELNAEFNNILNNPVSLISPLTATLDLDGQRLTLDSDGDLNLLTTSDDVLALRKDTTSLFVWDAATASVVNGLQFLSTVANDSVEIQAQGTDAQIHVRMVPKGAQATVSSSGGWAVEGTTEAEWRIDASAGDFLLQENTGSVAAPTWTTRWTLAAGASVGTAVLVNTGTGTTNVPLVSDILGNQTAWIPASAMFPQTTNGCAPLVQVEITANRPELMVLDFDGTSVEWAQFKVVFPGSYNSGTITYRVFWTSTATDTDGVAWQLSGVSPGDGNGIASTAFGTAVVVTDSAQSIANLMYMSSVSSAVTVTAAATNRVAWLRIGRDPDNGSDTMAEDARLIGLYVLYTSNSLHD